MQLCQCAAKSRVLPFPCGERPDDYRKRTAVFFEFQSTLPVWGATLRCQNQSFGDIISIHAPRVGSDADLQPGQIQALVFQSTLPSRGATDSYTPLFGGVFISIHAPLAGGDVHGAYHTGHRRISIHAPRVGSDSGTDCTMSCSSTFQSTLPSRGATMSALALRWKKQFQSTLPSRGATHSWPIPPNLFTNFNPRSPRGERPPMIYERAIVRGFQSTLPSRGATSWLQGFQQQKTISIHAPLAGSDDWWCFHYKYFVAFQSTLPSRGATAKMHKIICAFQQLYTKLSLSIEL